MRKQTLLFAVVISILTCSFLPTNKEAKKSAISRATVDTLTWVGLLETQTECEIYYSLVQCGEDKKLLLKYYNEVPFNQNIKFKVTIKYLGYVITEEKVKSVTPNQTIAADCSSTDINLFVKLLPPNWDFSNTTVTAELIEVTN